MQLPGGCKRLMMTSAESQSSCWQSALTGVNTWQVQNRPPASVCSPHRAIAFTLLAVHNVANNYDQHDARKKQPSEQALGDRNLHPHAHLLALPSTLTHDLLDPKLLSASAGRHMIIASANFGDCIASIRFLLIVMWGVPGAELFPPHTLFTMHGTCGPSRPKSAAAKQHFQR